MAVKQALGFTGVTDSDVRINEPVRMADIETVAEDQAYLYETITGSQVPDAGLISATPHIHDGTTGLPLPIPLAHGSPLVQMAARTTSGQSWHPMILSPFFCPDGVTSAVWVGLTYNVITAELLRVRALDSALGFVEGPRHVEVQQTSRPLPGGLHLLYAEVTTTPGTVNHLYLEGWDSHVTPPGGNLMSWALFPSLALGAVSVPAWAEPRYSSTTYRTPGLTQHGGSSAYTSMDEGFFADKRSINSWLVQGMALNDALLFELATGRPAGDLSSTHTRDRRYKGHSHGNEVDLDNCGALIHQPLGSWSYGVARRWSASSGHMTNDMGAGTEYTWRGRIHAPTITGVAAAYHTVGEHQFRLPALNEINARDSVGGSTTKISGSVLVRADQSKTGNVDVRLTLFDPNGVAADGSSVVASVTSGVGLHVLSFSDLDATGDPADTGIPQGLRVEIQQASSTFNEACIYGACAWVGR